MTIKCEEDLWGEPSATTTINADIDTISKLTWQLTNQGDLCIESLLHATLVYLLLF